MDMILSNKTGSPLSHGCHGDRSHSDDKNSSHIQPDAAMIMGTNESNAPLSKMTATKSHLRHGHGHGHRRRSKSCDLHRHSHSPLAMRKKKYPTHHKHIFLNHSYPAQHQHGRASSPIKLNTYSKFHGNMWIRPVAIRSRRQYIPVPKGQQAGGTSDTINNIFASFSPLDHTSPDRYMTVSPVFDNDDEMMCYASFDSIEQRIKSPKYSRISFGENGKPIKPRTNASFIQPNVVPVGAI